MPGSTIINRGCRRKKSASCTNTVTGPPRRLEFAALSFEPMAKQVEKWIDDCGLFIFGYLVRKFSENVLRQNLSEEEIWVVSSFDTCINVVKQHSLE